MWYDTMIYIYSMYSTHQMQSVLDLDSRGRPTGPFDLRLCGMKPSADCSAARPTEKLGGSRCWTPS